MQFSLLTDEIGDFGPVAGVKDGVADGFKAADGVEERDVFLLDFFKIVIGYDVAKLADFCAFVAICTFYIKKQIIHNHALYRYNLAIKPYQKSQ